MTRGFRNEISRLQIKFSSFIIIDDICSILSKQSELIKLIVSNKKMSHLKCLFNQLCLVSLIFVGSLDNAEGKFQSFIPFLLAAYLYRLLWNVPTQSFLTVVMNSYYLHWLQQFCYKHSITQFTDNTQHLLLTYQFY